LVLNNDIRDDDLRLAVESFREFLVREVRPIVDEYRDRIIPPKRMREIAEGIAEFGLPQGAIPQMCGGLGLSWSSQGTLFEELARVSYEVALAVMNNMLCAHLLLGAADHLRDRYLPGLLSGKLFGGFAGVDAEFAPDEPEWGIGARLERDRIVVDGVWTSYANATYSDFLICTARPGADVPALLVVGRHEDCYEIFHGRKRGAHRRIGGLVPLTAVRTCPENLIGRGGMEKERTGKLANVAKAYTGLVAVGLMRAALEESIAYDGERTDCEGPMTVNPLHVERAIDMAIRTSAARHMSFSVLGLVDAGRNCGAEAAMAKRFAAESAVKTCQDALQLDGSRETHDFQLPHCCCSAGDGRVHC
jgi:alkylation response protein AidB-like acyl-CoA dehydrogenase